MLADLAVCHDVAIRTDAVVCLDTELQQDVWLIIERIVEAQRLVQLHITHIHYFHARECRCAGRRPPPRRGGVCDGLCYCRYTPSCNYARKRQRYFEEVPLALICGTRR